MTHRRHVLIIIIFVVFLVGITLPTGSPDRNNETIITQDTEQIVIEGDVDLESQGWPGSGSDSDPYVLEGLDFENAVGPYISVSHVSSSLLISECQFVNASGEWWEEEFGVKLFNVSNVRIVNCTFIGYGAHIFVRNASLLEIADCEFMRGVAIIPEFVVEIDFHNNILENCGIGEAFFVERLNFHSNQVNLTDYGTRIATIESEWVNVSWNRVSGDFNLYLSADNIVVMNNTFEGETLVYLSGTRTPNPVYQIVNNTFAAGGISFYDWLPFDAIMEQVDFSGNQIGNRPVLFLKDDDGSHIDPSEIAQLIGFRCTNLQISGSFVDTTNPILLVRCTNTRIQELTISDSRTGISLYLCTNTIIDDLIVQDSYFGISMIKSNLTTISRGQFSSLSGGIIIETCDNTTITDCTFTDLRYALQMYGTRFSLIYNNTFDASWINVEYWYLISPTDRWDNGLGIGNIWNDYNGESVYFVAVGEWWTIVDNYPRGMNAVSEVLFPFDLSIVFLLVGLSIVMSAMTILDVKREEQKRSKYCNFKILATVILISLVSPSVLVAGSSPLGDFHWLVASPLFIVWSDLGNIFAFGPVWRPYIRPSYRFYPALPSPNFLFLAQMTLIFAYTLKKGGYRKASAISLLLTAFTLLISATGGTVLIYRTMSGFIPFPIAAVLAYVFFTKLVPEEDYGVDDTRRPSGQRAQCSECQATYHYSKEAIRNNTATCQNCGKDFILDGPLD